MNSNLFYWSYRGFLTSRDTLLVRRLLNLGAAFVDEVYVGVDRVVE